MQKQTKDYYCHTAQMIVYFSGFYTCYYQFAAIRVEYEVAGFVSSHSTLNKENLLNFLFFRWCGMVIASSKRCFFNVCSKIHTFTFFFWWAYLIYMYLAIMDTIIRIKNTWEVSTYLLLFIETLKICGFSISTFDAKRSKKTSRIIENPQTDK